MLWTALRHISKRSPCNEALPERITGIVKLSKIEENDPLRETYWTETFDMSAHNAEGKKLFESFHVLAIPEDRWETFQKMRKQVRQSLVSDLEEIVQDLRQRGC
jgi:hypothetical protein